MDGWMDELIKMTDKVTKKYNQEVVLGNRISINLEPSRTMMKKHSCGLGMAWSVNMGRWEKPLLVM